MTDEQKKYYDEMGEPIEEELVSKAEVDAIKEAKEAEMAEIKEKLAKMENKEFNFKKVRDMNKEEKEKLSIKELELLKRQEALEESQNEFQTSQINSYKADKIRELAGDDEELREKIEFHFNRLSDDAKGKEEIEKKVLDAYRLTGAKKEINPINQAAAHYGKGSMRSEETRFIDTEEGKAEARKLGLGFIRAQDAKNAKKEE